MKRASVLLGLCLACAGAASAAIDFSPDTGERLLDGIKFPQLIFHEGGRAITYEHPRGWSYSGGGPSIKFLPPGIAQAEGEIQQAPLAAPQALDEPTLKALQQQTLALVPPGSLNVALLSEEKNPILVNGNETYEATFRYTFYGQEFQVSALFINLPHIQLRMRTTAKKEDFQKVHNAFRASALSFQGLKPGGT